MDQSASNFDNLRLSVKATTIGLILMIAVAYYVNWDQAKSIRDLQRRVSQLEGEKGTNPQ
jgi:hypothetical protein